MLGNLRVWAGAAAAGLVVAVPGAAAGPLNPPAGAVAPTMKTLAQVEPRTPISAETTPGSSDSVFRITQPGSYYLTGNISAPNNSAAIEIAASNVTVDLGGFVVGRSGTGASNRSLIRSSTGFETHITVRNGTVVNSGQFGVELGFAARVEGCRVINAAQVGIRVASFGVVADCVVDSPGTVGVDAGPNSLVQRVQVSGAGGNGIVVSNDSRVTECIVHQATGVGIQAANQSVVEGCSVSHGSSWGISANLNTANQTFRNNSVYNNAAGGIRVYLRSEVVGNGCHSLTLGVPNILAVTSGSRIEGNRCSGGTDAVRVGPSGFDNLVFGNWSVNASIGNGFANIGAASNLLGPVVTSQGFITTSSPYANFSR